jgi:divalent metal cation (Fe/Co/Zn/Cd) transporter
MLREGRAADLLTDFYPGKSIGKASHTGMATAASPKLWIVSASRVIEEIRHAANHVPGVEDIGEIRVRWIGHRLLAVVNLAVRSEMRWERREHQHLQG